MELKLNEFKALYETLETGTIWIDHLLLGLLVWLEEKMINARVKTEVDEAIKGWESLHPPTIPTPIYTERTVETSTSLPEMRLRAPWLDGTDDTVEGR